MKRATIFKSIIMLLIIFSPLVAKGNLLRTGNALVTEARKYIGRPDTYGQGGDPPQIQDKYGNWVLIEGHETYFKVYTFIIRCNQSESCASIKMPS